jgi:hypothetical protein
MMANAIQDPLVNLGLLEAKVPEELSTMGPRMLCSHDD